MNPRRVHELMTTHFPTVDLASLTWVNLQEHDGTLRANVLVALLDEFINGADVLVEVNRKLGDLLPRQDVVPYVEKNVGSSMIRIADRAFQGYVLVGANGVAAGWLPSRS